MAFFCPIRVRKGKKKKDNDLLDGKAPSITGRITGSNSMDTIVRVGLEKEHGIPSDSRMIVLHDFAPCVDDELEVKRGQIVTVLYQENDWVYVIRDSDNSSSSSSTNSEGFIPYSYCTPVSSQLADMVIKHKKIPRNAAAAAISTGDPAAALVAAANANNHQQHHSQHHYGSTGSNLYHSFNQLIHASNNNNNHHHHHQHHVKDGLSPVGPGVPGTGVNATSAQKQHQQSSIILMHHLACNSDSDAGKDGDSYTGASASEIHPFFKDPAGHRFIVLYTFIARDENDVSVERGEFVSVLNMDDIDWYWILRSDGLEGFVPSAFLCSLDHDSMTGSKKKQQQQPQSSSFGAVTNGNTGNNNSNNNNITSGNGAAGVTMPLGISSNQLMSNHQNAANINITTEESTTYSNSIDGNSQHGLPISTSTDTEMSRFHGDELVMLYDYTAQAPDDLSVSRGDWVYADLKAQTIDGWLWAFAPKLKKYGFIPKAYARPPAMTSI